MSDEPFAQYATDFLTTVDVTILPARDFAERDFRQLLSGFSSGNEDLDAWLQGRAIKNEARGLTRLRLAISNHDGSLCGYYGLLASELRRTGIVRSRDRRNKPGSIPALKLGQLAVRADLQGRGYGRQMMMGMFADALLVSRTVGASCLLTDPIDDRAAAFYGVFGFEPLHPETGHGMMIRMSTIADLLETVGADE